jgi:hypothetical protein
MHGTLRKIHDRRCNSPISTPKVVGTKIFRAQMLLLLLTFDLHKRKQADAEIRLLCRNAPEKQKTHHHQHQHHLLLLLLLLLFFLLLTYKYILITNAAAAHDDD